MKKLPQYIFMKLDSYQNLSTNLRICLCGYRCGAQARARHSASFHRRRVTSVTDGSTLESQWLRDMEYLIEKQGLWRWLRWKTICVSICETGGPVFRSPGSSEKLGLVAGICNPRLQRDSWPANFT